ncbi:FGGY-family carbohydrate kinase [Lichenihabitans psoromatis]|uniref:FGGY-family carbohydrate kinase n=1 Tax=Lichenihabitans psoromatis TaxID=2528642 RepID=UPI001FE23B68|nr:FGGY-family carbohydrate kinase [Lichenihabitans psoromatis]
MAWIADPNAVKLPVLTEGGMVYFMGVDIGTFESKGVLTTADGRIVARAMQPHKMIVPQPGWAEHRAEEDWWGDFTVIARKLLAESGVDPSDVKAVAASAIGPCMLPLDEAGQPLCNGVLYGVDTRAADEIEQLTTAIGRDTLLARCGNALTSQSVGPKILWLKNKRPDLYARARMFLSATPYITYRLTGDYVMDHFTAAGFTPLYDAAANAWSSDFADGIVDLAYLPRLIWSSDIAGTVTEQAARETGLAVGTPVLCGTIDAAAEAVSVGVTGPGDMMLMYGSTIFVILVTAKPVRDSRLWYAPWLFEGLEASQAGLATSGTLTRWFADQFAREIDPAEVMQTMAREGATSPPGAKGLVVLPYFSGERTPIHDTKAKGCIFGLDLTHTRADVYRAMIEGIGFAVRHITETYADVGQPPERVIAVGGGTNNAVWLKAVSDASGHAQILREVTTGASLGDAFLAAVATGYAVLGDIERWNATVRVEQPDESTQRIYDRRFPIYKALYQQTKDLMAALSDMRDA